MKDLAPSLPSAFRGKGTIDETRPTRTTLAVPTHDSEQQPNHTPKHATRLTSSTGNRNQSSSKLIDDILGRKKGKANGTVIDTATGLPSTHEQQGTGGTTATEPDVKETAAIAEEKHKLDAAQQNAEISTPTVKEQPSSSTAAGAGAAAAPPPSTMPPSAAAPTAVTETPAPASTTAAGAETAKSEEKGKEKEKEPERGRGKEFESIPAKDRKVEPSLSPGRLPDGRHAQTDGDKGMSYAPPKGLGKIGAKLGLGHH